MYNFVMTLIKKLEDIQIYHEGLRLCQSIYLLTRLPEMKRDFSLIDQARRAALSVPANIAEGYGRKSRKDFAHFLSISLGSANEVLCYLDFIQLEYKANIMQIKVEYTSLCSRIHAFRTHLLTTTYP